jgi:hypothetical protein
VVYHYSDAASFGFSIENPEQQVGSISATPTPGFGAKLVPSCKGLAGSLPQHSPKKLPKKSGK